MSITSRTSKPSTKMHAASDRPTRACSSSDDGQPFRRDAGGQAAFLRVAEEVGGPRGEAAVAQPFAAAVDAESGAGVIARALGPLGVLGERDAERRADRVIDPV